jgi:hypothetical protein
MTPKFSNIYSSGELTLCCPNCDCEYMHQYRTEVFELPHEDAITGLRVIVDDMEARIATTLQGNPSGRRNGIVIYFTCEGCDKITLFSIYQHKGQTLLNASTPG